MVMNIEEITEIHSGMSAVIVGPAPSIHTVANHEKNIGFWLGDAHQRVKVMTSPSYYVRANSIYPSLFNQSDIKSLIDNNFVCIFAETVMESDFPVREKLEQVLGNNHYVFDQRHFNRMKCSPPKSCCEVLDRYPNEVTIQELVTKLTDFKHHYSTGDTVALHAFAASVLAGVSTISFSGVEIPFWADSYIYASQKLQNSQISITNKIRSSFVQFKAHPRIELGKVKNKVLQVLIPKRNSSKISLFAEGFPSLFADFQLLLDIALIRGTRVYYCSRTSNLRFLNGIEPCPLCLLHES